MTISTPFALKRNETTPFTRTFLDDIDAAAARTTLGLGDVENAAASDLYLPLAGGTLTGPITGTSNIVQQQNGLNAQRYDLFKTFTSSTSFEAFSLDTISSASAYRIGSRIGSAGGGGRRLEIGGWNAAGAFTKAAVFNADGTASFGQFEDIRLTGSYGSIGKSNRILDIWYRSGPGEIDFRAGRVGPTTIRTGTYGFWAVDNSAALRVFGLSDLTELNRVPTNANWVQLTHNGTNAKLECGGIGTGAGDRDLQLIPEGAGLVSFGSHSAISAETVTGFITIKDSSGVLRKLAVLS